MPSPGPTAPMLATKPGSVADVFTALGTAAPAAAATADYAETLNLALEDRVLDAAEVDALVEKARMLGLDSITLGSLHRGHFDEVVREAWSDGVLTDAERGR